MTSPRFQIRSTEPPAQPTHKHQTGGAHTMTSDNIKSSDRDRDRLCWCGAPAIVLNEATDATDEHLACKDHMKDGYTPLDTFVIDDDDDCADDILPEPKCWAIWNADMTYREGTHFTQRPEGEYVAPGDVLRDWMESSSTNLQDGHYWVGVLPTEETEYSVFFSRVTVERHLSIY